MAHWLNDGLSSTLLVEVIRLDNHRDRLVVKRVFFIYNLDSLDLRLRVQAFA